MSELRFARIVEACLSEVEDDVVVSGKLVLKEALEVY